MRLIHSPILCNYYVTYRCNATCGFCDIWERPSPYVKVEDVARNLDDLKELGVKVIDFTGGEPLLHRELHLFLRMAKERGFITTVTTNALLYPKRAESLHGLVDMLHFSLDADNAVDHNASRGVDCFDAVLRSIRIARTLGERPDILLTVTEENQDQIRGVYENICLPDNLVLILNPIFDYGTIDAGGQLSEDLLKKLHRWGRRKNVYLNEAFLRLRMDGGNHIKDPVCKAASSTVVISPMNELVLPCYHLGVDALPINGRLTELYRSKNVQRLIALEGRHEACEGCTINCYMQPSFAVEINKYFWKALPSTLKYNRIKGTYKQLLRGTSP